MKVLLTATGSYGTLGAGGRWGVFRLHWTVMLVFRRVASFHHHRQIVWMSEVYLPCSVSMDIVFHVGVLSLCVGRSSGSMERTQRQHHMWGIEGVLHSCCEMAVVTGQGSSSCYLLVCLAWFAVESM